MGLGKQSCEEGRRGGRRKCKRERAGEGRERERMGEGRTREGGEGGTREGKRMEGGAREGERKREV